jgi:cytochrome c oxidase subunit 1/cytochrome c oxidase subunit I+III
MPGDSLLPFLLSLAMTGLFTALLLRSLWVGAPSAMAILVVLVLWLVPRPHPEAERVDLHG